MKKLLEYMKNSITRIAQNPTFLKAFLVVATTVIVLCVSLVIGVYVFAVMDAAATSRPVFVETTGSMETTTPATEPEVTHGEDTQPVETVPETTHGEEVTEPAETVPETVPAVTEPAETVPETVPATEPVVTEPEETEPKPTEPVKPTEPKPTEPPKETQPKPTEPPKPTDPKPTEPPKTHTHSYKAKVVEPTCEEKGYTVHTCSCGDSYTDTEKAALGHDLIEEVSEPGPGYQGYTYHYCSRCAYSYADNYTDALPTFTEEDVQKAIIKYINQYRAAQGSTQLTYLPGMTQVAKYRSKQLVTNFAHDTADMREATTYYKYGRYIDWAEYGCPELVNENYYDADSNEAIG